MTDIILSFSKTGAFDMVDGLAANECRQSTLHDGDTTGKVSTIQPLNALINWEENDGRSGHFDTLGCNGSQGKVEFDARRGRGLGRRSEESGGGVQTLFQGNEAFIKLCHHVGERSDGGAERFIIIGWEKTAFI